MTQPGTEVFCFVFIYRSELVCLFSENLHFEKNNEGIV